MDTVPDRPDASPIFIAELVASQAEAEQGEHIPMQPVLDRMQAAIDRIHAKRAKSAEA